MSMRCTVATHVLLEALSKDLEISSSMDVESAPATSCIK